MEKKISKQNNETYVNRSFIGFSLDRLFLSKVKADNDYSNHSIGRKLNKIIK